MAYDFKIVEGAAQPVAAIRVKVQSSDVGAILAQLLPEVFGWLQSKGIAPAGRPFVRYHEMGTGEMDIEAGIPIVGGVSGEGRIAIGELPGGPLATTTHVGHYEKLSEAHDALGAWLASEGHTERGARWESYVSDPTEQPDPARWETQIFCPVLAG